MAKVRKSLSLLSEEKRRKSINDIIIFFKSERDEEIGMIAAEKILDHFLQTVGKELYNKGVEDSRDFIGERIESLEFDMEAFLKK